MIETLFEPLAVGLDNLLYNLIVASVGYFYLHLDLLLIYIFVTSIFDLIWFACLGGTCGNLMAYDAKNIHEVDAICLCLHVVPVFDLEC